MLLLFVALCVGAIDIVEHSGMRYLSSVVCDGNMKEIDLHNERICIFKNVCYRKSTNLFEYYTHAQTEKQLREDPEQFAIMYEENLGPLVQVGSNFSLPLLTVSQAKTPKPSESIRIVKEMHIYDQRKEHLFWDVIFNTFWSLTNLLVPFEPKHIHLISPSPSLEQFRPVVSDHMVQTFEALMEGHEDVVCFETYLPEMAIPVVGYPDNWVKSNLFLEFRNVVMKRYGMDPFDIPDKHLVVTSEEKYAQLVRKSFPQIEVEVIDVKKKSFEELLQLFGRVTIFITDGHYMIPFLMPGGHAVMIDAGGREVWDSVGHINKHHLVGSSWSDEDVLALVEECLLWVY